MVSVYLLLNSSGPTSTEQCALVPELLFIRRVRGQQVYREQKPIAHLIKRVVKTAGEGSFATLPLLWVGLRTDLHARIHDG